MGESQSTILVEVTAKSYSFNPPLVRDLIFAEREGEECVRRVLEELSDEAGVGNHVECATEGDDEDETSFVDIIRHGWC